MVTAIAIPVLFYRHAKNSNQRSTCKYFCSLFNPTVYTITEDDKLIIFFFKFFQKIGFNSSCKLSPKDIKPALSLCHDSQSF